MAALLFALTPLSFCQQQTPPARTKDRTSKRIFWIIPNYRTSPALAVYKPLTPREKFAIASEDTFDRGTFALAALFAGEADLAGDDRSFGGGVKAYAHYYATSYGDFATGNFMTEGVFPAMLHQDPRYFRRGTGSVWSRFLYSTGQIFITHGDNGRKQFNFSEIGGNSAAVAVSMAWYPRNRDAGDAVSQLGVQLGVDMAANLLKEFEPDLARALFHRHPR